MDIQNSFAIIQEQLPILKAMIIAIVLLIIINFFTKTIKKRLLDKAHSKKQVSNIKILARIINILFSTFAVVFIFFSYIGSWTGLGIVAGLLTAALGFALQKPITGIAAWIMVIVKRPFSIGDRIKIGDIRGDVYDISLTHIYIDEVGGLVTGDETSGRHVLVPNYLLFEQNIINYTMLNEYVIGEVLVEITYDSDLNKALDLIKKISNEVVKEHLKKSKKELQVRVSMEPTGVRIKSRFFAPIKQIQEITSEITLKIYNEFKKNKHIAFSYTHHKGILEDKK